MKYLIVSIVFCVNSVIAQTTYKDVEPIFKKNCIACHSSSHKMGGLSLDGYNEIMDYVVSGQPAQSDLWIAISSGMMPMNKKMDTKEKGIIKKWILNGSLFKK